MTIRRTYPDGTVVAFDVLDEDNMASNSATAVPTQQSVKAYADSVAAPAYATTTTSGVIELATQAEVDAGTSTDRAVTPSTLANYSGLGSAGGSSTISHSAAGALALAPTVDTIVVNASANVTDHTWSADGGTARTLKVIYTNTGAATISVDLASGYRTLPDETAGTAGTVNLNPGAWLQVVAVNTGNWTTTDPIIFSSTLLEEGTPPPAPVSVVGSGELAYNSGTTFTVPAGALPGDILLVGVTSAGSGGDPGAATATVPAGSLTQLYSVWPGAGAFQPRQTLLYRTIAVGDEGDTCTVAPGTEVESIGWVLFRGLSAVSTTTPAPAHLSGSADDGIDFPAVTTQNDGDVVILFGSAQATTGTAADPASLNDQEFVPVITQMNNGRGNFIAYRIVDTAGTVTPGSLLKAGGGNYDNWIGTTFVGLG